MKIGLIGLPSSGKSTLLRLLTKGEAGGQGKANIGVAPVPDPRVDALIDMYKPQRAVYAQLECTELPSLQLQQAGSSGGGVGAQQLAEALRHVDAIVQVVRAFSAPHVPHVLGDVQPFRDAQMVYEELVLMDWSLVETRLTRLKEARQKGLRHDEEIALFERLQPELEAGRPLRAVEFTKDEEALLRTYSFLTTKPLILAVNVDEDQLRDGVFDEREELLAWAKERSVPVVEVAALIEAEIEELPADEQAAFLEDLGLQQSGVARLARSAYDALDLISFFTAFVREVRAWTVPRGTPAREAARVIHSDIQRGFIRAEVVHFDELMREGSMAAVKEKGLLRLEGKDYPVQDGDMIHFRFNV